MSDLRPLSSSISKLTSETFSKKFVALGRVLNSWNDIIGPDMAVKTQPVKIHYRKPKEKGEKPQATLEIAASSADSTILHYQKDLILERINQLFGDQWITGIRFVHYAEKTSGASPILVSRPVNQKDLEKLDHWLDEVNDEEIRKSLEKLGQSVLRKEQQKSSHRK